MAWWNAADCGSFDLTNLWNLDREIVADMTIVFQMIGRLHSYPDTLGYKEHFVAIVEAWRPEFAQQT